MPHPTAAVEELHSGVGGFETEVVARVGAYEGDGCRFAGGVGGVDVGEDVAEGFEEGGAVVGYAGYEAEGGVDVDGWVGAGWGMSRA